MFPRCPALAHDGPPTSATAAGAVTHGRRSQPPGPRTRTALLTLVPCLLVAAATSPVTAADLRTAQQQYDSGQYDACLEMAAGEVERGVWNVRWPMLLIRCQLTTGQYDAALRTYEAAAKRFSFGNIELHLLGAEVFRYNGQPERATEELARIQAFIEQASGRFLGQENLVAMGRYLVSRGEDARKILENLYDRVIDASPDYVDAYIASAELALQKNDYRLAAEAAGKAAALAPTDPAVALLQFRAWETTDPQRAEEALNRALQLNPHHVPSLLQVADHAIDAEQYDQARETLRKVLQINMHQPEAWAYRAVLAHLDGQPEIEALMRAAALSIWPTNPAVDHLIGLKLSQKYRFAEGAAYQRRAIAFDPQSVQARFQLSQDLLRLGQDEEGWQLARSVQQDDPYNVVAYNLMNLHDALDDFRVLQRDGILLRMDAREAEIYGQQALDLLTEARAVLCEKYDVRPEAPVVIEIFPRQSDFAIRTFGLPGGDGFLGVCFGRVITANSPASQGAAPANWQSVLWHEFAHVATLQKTNNKMPRWLSEGISVYEERQRDPRWGQQMTPQFREMILGEDLTPVSELSAAFLNPKSGMHLQLAYYESSLVVQFLVERHGFDVLLRVLDDLRIGMPINESLGRYTGSLAQLDAEFHDYATQLARELGDNVQWDQEDVPDANDLQALRAFVGRQPRNYWGLRRWGQAALAAERYDDALSAAEKLQALYPDDASPGCGAELLANIHRQRGDSDAEFAALQQLADLRDDDLPTYSRLAQLAKEREDWVTMLTSAQRTLAVNPLIPVGQEALADAAEALGEHQQLYEALAALAMMEPVDPAGLHYRTAVALHKLDRGQDAKRHVLMAIEEAPRYRDAHRLLLQLVHGGHEQPAAPDELTELETSTDASASVELQTPAPEADEES